MGATPSKLPIHGVAYAVISLAPRYSLTFITPYKNQFSLITMEALFVLVIIIVVVTYLVIKRPRKKELTPYERQKQVEEMAKGVEELINEVVQESEYGKKTNEEIERLRSEVKQLRKELSELKKDDHDKQIKKE